MVEPEAPLSMRKQCELLSVSRSGLYYQPSPTSTDELDLMRRIDKLHLKWPHLGSRKLARELAKQGLSVNRKHVQRLMRLMDIVAMVPKPDTSRPAPEHATYPYLLRNLEISRVNQVWATDIVSARHG
jgi:putative transposase